MSTTNVVIDRIPQALRELPQWVLWKIASRASGEKPTKLPFTVAGDLAKANDASTWTTFEAAAERYQRGGYAGIGFEFAADDPFCGIDLDGCRDPESGAVAEWAREIIASIDSYAEVSPSQTGVKIFIRGRLPTDRGLKKSIDAPRVCDKAPAIEVYDRGRYFAVTGWRLKGQTDPQPRQAALDALLAKHFPEPTARQVGADWHSHDAVVERARKYVATMPPAISGQGGHPATFRVACALVLGFGLSDDVALELLREFNQVCDPPWSDKELEHKIRSAAKQPGERNYLRNATPQRWSAITFPEYREPKEEVKAEVRTTTLLRASTAYLETLRRGDVRLVETGIPNLDAAIGGGIEYGEMVILAARPSHGKSMCALQVVHHWTANANTVLLISEEMSAMALGKRALQFASDVHESLWERDLPVVDSDLKDFFERRAECYIAESCGSVQAVVEQIERHVAEFGVRHVVVDYAQLLRSSGKSRYEQVTNTSIALRQVASKHNLIVLVLCQLSRDIEKRSTFTPQMADLKETGQLEQDADVIVFLVWPHRIDSSQPPEDFQLFIAKNRNRQIVRAAFKCRFEPGRQRLLAEGKEFSTWDQSTEWAP